MRKHSFIVDDLNDARNNKTFSSDVETEKSNEISSFTSTQLADLENEIMMKILKYFEENYNFSNEHFHSNEIWYSPISKRECF
jgi:hypothetical protein